MQDNAGTDNGGANTSAARTFRITISSVNDVPVAVADPYTVAEGATLTVLPADGVRTNDTDVEDVTPTGDVALVTPPAHHVGQFILNTNGSFTYTHNGTETPTTDTFTYRVTDSAGAYSNVATVTITITPDNETPTAVADSGAAFTINEDAPTFTTPNVTTNDTDPEDGTPAGAVVVTVPLAPATAGTLVNKGDGTFDFTPAANFNGNATFSYTVDDSGAATSNPATVTITVTPVNDEPSFTLTNTPDQTVLEDAGAQTVIDLLTGSDTGAANESAQILTLPVSNDNNSLFSAQPTISLVTGDLTYTTAPNANGSATVTVFISDNGGTTNGGDDTSDAQTFTITVTPVNDAPSFTKGSNVTVAEDSGSYTEADWATAISVGPANEVGIPAQSPLTFALTPADTTLFSAGPAISDTGELTFTPASNANGSTLVTVSLQDNAGTDNGGANTSAAQSFRITISSINDVPVANADGGLTAPITVEEGETLNVASGLIRSNDTDVEDIIPTGDITLVTQPAHHVGLFVLNPDGSFTYTHDGSETPATDTFAYRVTDSAGRRTPTSPPSRSPSPPSTKPQSPSMMVALRSRSTKTPQRSPHRTSRPTTPTPKTAPRPAPSS